jgi:hypothetical protein
MVKKVHLENKALPIREFKLESFCENPSIAIIAKRGSGKTILCRYLLKYFLEKDKIPAGLIISPTDKLNKFYGERFPDLFIHSKYKPIITENLLYRQAEMKDKRLEYKKKGRKVDHRCVLLMDDCLGKSSEWKKDDNLQEMLLNGRHYGITYMLTLQDPLGIGPLMRGNFDYVFILADDNYKNIERVYLNYAGIFPTKESFAKTFAELTKDYGCLVLVNRGVRNDFFDKVFWFKSGLDEIEPEKFKSKQFLKYHTDNFEEDYKRKNRKGVGIDMMITKQKQDKTNFEIIKK